jgi:RHS repeat-associated protein
MVKKLTSTILTVTLIFTCVINEGLVLAFGESLDGTGLEYTSYTPYEEAILDLEHSDMDSAELGIDVTGVGFEAQDLDITGEGFETQDMDITDGGIEIETPTVGANQTTDEELEAIANKITSMSALTSSGASSPLSEEGEETTSPGGTLYDPQAVGNSVDRNRYPVGPFSFDTARTENIIKNTGTLQYREIDVVFPGKNGLDIALGIKYDSSKAERLSIEQIENENKTTDRQPSTSDNILRDFAYGWSFTFTSMSWEGGNPYFTLADGRTYAYNEYAPICNLTGNATTSISAEKVDDEEFYYARRGSCYRLTYEDGRKEYFDDKGYLIGIVDRYGNTITFMYSVWYGTNYVVEIKDTYGRYITLQRPNSEEDPENVILLMPDKTKMRYMVEANTLYAKRGFSGETTNYYTDFVEANFHLSWRPEGCMTMDAFYSQVSPHITGSATPTVGWRFVALLKGITYPDGTSTEYEYYTKSGSHVHYNGEEHIGFESLSQFATLGRNGFEAIAAVKERKDKIAGSNVEYNKHTYSYVASSANNLENYSGFLNIKNTDKNTADTLSSAHSYYTYITDVSRGVNYTFFYDSKHNKKEERRTKDGVQFYREEPTKYYSAVEGVLTALPKNVKYYIDGQVYEETYDYDITGRMKSYATSIPNGTGSVNYVETVVHDNGTGLLLSRTYKKDANTTVVETNTLTPDGKSIEKSEVTEGGVLKKRTTYKYNTDNTLLWKREYKTATTYIQTDYTYDHTLTIDEEYNTYTVMASKGGVTEKTVYNIRGFVESFTDGKNNTTTYTYDASDNPKKTIYPDATTKQYGYDIWGNSVRVDDENGHWVRYYFTPDGQIKRVVENNITVKQFEYDQAYRLKKETDEAGNTCEYEYDYMDRLLGKTIKAGSTILYKENYAYSGAGTNAAAYSKTIKTVTGETGAPDIKTATYYDRLGRMYKTAFINGSTELANADTYKYNYDGAVIEYRSAADMEAARAHTKKYTVDFEGRILTDTNQESGVITYAYDMLGRKISQVDELGYTSSFEYHDTGGLKKETIPFEGSYNSTRRYEYDKSGNMKEQYVSINKPGTTAKESKTIYGYDSKNRLASVALYNGSSIAESVAYEYYNDGNLKNITDGKGNKTKYEYDSRDRLLKITDPLSAIESFQYGVSGYKTYVTKTDRNGAQITSYYDGMERPTNITAKEAGGAAASEYITNTYAKTGAILKGQNENLTVNYTYNNYGMNETQTQSNGITKNFTYDPDGKRKTFILKQNTTQKLNEAYSYDSAGRLSEVKNDGSTVASYTYYKTHMLDTASYPAASLTSKYVYGKAGQLTSLTNKRSNTTLSSFTYGYYLDGNQASRTSGGSSGSGTINYTYDDLRQLKTETGDSQSKSYNYDTAGNRTVMTVSGTGAMTVSYDYDNNNRLTTETKDLTGGMQEKYSYFYDKNGNLTARSAETITTSSSQTPAISAVVTGGSNVNALATELYAYDVLGRLTSVTNGYGTSTYNYQPDNLRLSKTVNGVKTTHIWDGQNIIAEMNASSSITGRYIRGVGIAASLDTAGTKQYFLYNGHGDVWQLTNASGTVTKTYGYDAFGNETSASASDVNPFRYAGEYYDKETGDYYLRARNYDPVIGRMHSEDTHWNPGNMIYGDNPITVNAHNESILNTGAYIPDNFAILQSGNLYVYCMNNPLMYEDENGEMTFLATMAIGGGIGVAFQIGNNLMSGNDWYQGVCTAMLAGCVSGALATVPIPGLNAVSSAIIMGGAGNVTGNIIRGDIDSFQDVIASFGVGAIAGGVGYGAGQGLIKIADKMWGELSRAARKQAITRLGNVSQKDVNIVLKEIRNGTTENIYRQLLKKYGADVMLAATVAAVGTEVNGK